MNTPTLFVAFSHSLTTSQVEGFFTQYGEGKIITLADVAPELQKNMGNIPATATLVEIQDLAKAIVAEAVKAGATHFFCTGEPTLTMWANLIANGNISSNWRLNPTGFNGLLDLFPLVVKKKKVHNYTVYQKLSVIQSTTERRSIEVTNPDGSVTKTQIFQHVQWREMF